MGVALEHLPLGNSPLQAVLIAWASTGTATLGLELVTGHWQVLAVDWRGSPGLASSLLPAIAFAAFIFMCPLAAGIRD